MDKAIPKQRSCTMALKQIWTKIPKWKKINKLKRNPKTIALKKRSSTTMLTDIISIGSKKPMNTNQRISIFIAKIHPSANKTNSSNSSCKLSKKAIIPHRSPLPSINNHFNRCINNSNNITKTNCNNWIKKYNNKTVSSKLKINKLKNSQNASSKISIWKIY